MPLYEGIGLISEKHAVVLDIGSAYTKIGFAGEVGPRAIVPTQVVDPKSNKEVNIFPCSDRETMLRLLLEFIHHIHFKHLLVNPKDRRIVIVESVLASTLFRETLAKVLFEHYEVSSVLFVPSHLMVLFTLGIASALVMDVGYEETQVFPIYEGIVMLNSGESVPLAGKAIHDSLRKLLMKQCTVQGSEKKVPLSESDVTLPESTLEDIKVRSCFVTTLERGHVLQSIDENKMGSYVAPSDIRYPLLGDKVMHIQGQVREQAAEVLFELDNDYQSLASIILNTIMKSPIDMRCILAENIVVAGGTSMIQGFKQRLKTELHYLLQRPPYQNALAIKKFKFHRLPAKENYAVWLGAAVFGATDVLTTRSLTREIYLQDRYVPDWCHGNVNDDRNDEKIL